MHTEDEAKKLWCPHVRALNASVRDRTFITDAPGTAASNRYMLDGGKIGIHDSCHCIASKCMAWRWADGPEDDVDGDTRADGRIAKAQGYCGLAGKL